MWSFAGDVPQTVDWAIVTGTMGSYSAPLASGTASLTTTYISTNGYGYDIDKESFNLPSVALAGGSTTYWLELGNAVVNTGNPLYWDENNGPSMAYQLNGIGNLYDYDCHGSTPLCGDDSQPFQILSTNATSTPEPGTLALLGTGLLFLVARHRRTSR